MIIYKKYIFDAVRDALVVFDAVVVLLVQVFFLDVQKGVTALDFLIDQVALLPLQDLVRSQVLIIKKELRDPLPPRWQFYY